MINHTSNIAIIVSDFNSHITEKLLEGALAHLWENGKIGDDITVVHVPGAVEIPLVAKALALTRQYAAIIALGAVIRGETGHYDFVCEQASQGCQKVMLDQLIPVIFGVLTTENEEQAQDRIGGKRGHKGREAAETALQMIRIMAAIK
jgi:6,7-dimethyl-8-ribityllumazine synthase